jgi:hypothetical protein
MIDDASPESSYIQTVKTRARDFGMKINHFERGKTGLSELEAYPSKYRALILDARCIWDEKGTTPKDTFLSIMIPELERLEQHLNTFFPAVVNTAHIEEFVEVREVIRERGGEIFLKASGNVDEESKIFRFIKDRIENSDGWKYRDVYSLFEKGYLPEVLRNDLADIVRNLNDSTNTKRNFNPLRKLLEAVYEGINASDPSRIPGQVFNGRGGGVNLEWTWRYLSGLPVDVRDNRGNSTRYQAAAVFPPHISKCVKACEDLSSLISHLYPNNVGIYSYRTAANALLETLVWFGDFIEADRARTTTH